MTAYNLRQVPRLAVALGDGCIPVAQHRRNRVPNDITSTEYNGISTRDLDACRLEKVYDPGGGARSKQRQRSARRQVAYVICMESRGNVNGICDVAYNDRAHPSTSFSGLTASVTMRSPSAPMWSPRGSWTRIPLTVSSLLSFFTISTISSTVASAGRVICLE